MAHILVVEDEPTDRVILADLLERMGHEVYCASDGEEAYKTCLKNDIEIIITDLNMPNVDGLEFIEAVLELFPRAAIVAVSAKGTEWLFAAQTAGARAALHKPIDPQELREVIAQVARDDSYSGREEKGTEGAEATGASEEPFILIVEDNPDEAALIHAALKKGVARNGTHLVSYGWEAQAYLNRDSGYDDWVRYPAPSLIVLDLGLPDITGLDILEWMAESKWLARIPVIVLTASTDPAHEERAYALGVRHYMCKPGDYEALADVVKEELSPSVPEMEQRKAIANARTPRG